MPQAATRSAVAQQPGDPGAGGGRAVEALLADATAKVRERVVLEGRPAARLLDREQRATHGLAWLATYVEAVRQLAAYAERMQERGLLAEIEELIVRIGLGEYLAADPGRHPDQPGRDRAAGRSRPLRRGGRGASDAGRRGADRHRQHRGATAPGWSS